MSSRTLHGVLHPDGTLTLSGESMPDHAVPVMVTILEQEGELLEQEHLAELGDYVTKLADYELRLARGEIQWQ
jgi:hypothetical protein